MANLQLIKTLAERQKMPITELAERAGISEQQIHLMVRTNSTKITTLEKIASILEVPVTVFFDEGRGGVTVKATDHSQAAGRDLHVATDDALMAERVKHLEAMLKEKDERISELKERIEDLKNK